MEDEQPVNPEELSPQERLSYLRTAVDEEDALNVLLGLHVMNNPEEELEMRSPKDGLTVLEYAVACPTTRPDVRKLLLELLLFKVSASTRLSALQRAQECGAKRAPELIRGWETGGRDQATDAQSLLVMTPGDAQEWLYDHGLAIDDDDEEEEDDQPAARPQEDVEMADVKPEVKQEAEDVKPKPEPMEDDQSVFGPSPPPPSSSHAGSQVSHLSTQPGQADNFQLTSSSTDLPPPPSKDTELFRQSPSASTRPKPESDPVPPEPPRGRSRSRSPRSRTVHASHSPIESRRRSPSPRPDRRRSSPPRERRRSASPSRRSRSPSRRSYSPRCDYKRSPSGPRQRQHSTPPPPRRRSPTPRSSQPPPSAAYWLSINHVPDSFAEYQLRKRLADEDIHCVDIRLGCYPQKPGRWAFVGLADSRAYHSALKVLRWPMDGNRPEVSNYRNPKTGSGDPGVRGPPYRGAFAESQLRAQGRAEVYFRHLRLDTTEDFLRDFIENSLGRDTIREMRLRNARNGTESIAFVEFQKHEECRRAIRRLDGVELRGWAMGVCWSEDALTSEDSSMPQADSSTTARRDFNRSSPPAHEPHFTSSNIQPLGATNRYAAACRSVSISAAAPAPAPAKLASSPSAALNGISSGSPPSLPSRLPSTVPPTTSASKPRAPVIACAVPEETDLARLRSVNIPESTIASLRKIWAPLKDKGEDKKDDELGNGDSDKRTLTIAVEFGFLPQREAKLALDENEREPAYPGEPEKQKRYEAFLKAQAGESKDWYTVFFAKLAEFNATAALFAKKAHELAAASSPPPPPPPP